MKTHIIHINGEKGKEITLPVAFSNAVRQDIVAKVLEAKKNKTALCSFSCRRKTAFCKRKNPAHKTRMENNAGKRDISCSPKNNVS